MSDDTKDLGLDQQKARSDLAEARAAMAWSDEALLASCAAAESALEAATARGASLDEIGHVAAAAMRAVLLSSKGARTGLAVPCAQIASATVRRMARNAVMRSSGRPP